MLWTLCGIKTFYKIFGTKARSRGHRNHWRRSMDKNLDPRHLRQQIIRMAKAGNSVHIACAFSLVEIVSALYSNFLDLKKIESHSPDCNRLILSKGHGVMAMYAAHYLLGHLSDSSLDQYFSDGSLLHGLCEAKVNGFEVSSGSLGHGLPIAVGVALAKKISKAKGQVYCIVGDGEMNEGPMWEALLFATHHNLNNLTVIVDANGFQAMGKIQEVLNLEPFSDKFKSFGFETFECDGHDTKELTSALKHESSRPLCVLARTVKGYGVSFMENNNEWHYRRLTPELYDAAIKELGI